MMFIWNILVAFINYVGPNLAWDSVKEAGKIVWKEKEKFQNLLYDSLVKAIEEHSKHYDNTASQMTHLLLKKIKHNKSLYLNWIESVSYDDLGVFINNLKNKNFQKELSRELINIYEIDYTENFDNLPNIIDDVFSYYRTSVITNIIKSKKADELVLLQVLKIDEIIENIETIHSQTSIIPEIKRELEELNVVIPDLKDKIERSIINVSDKVVDEKKQNLIFKVREIFESRQFNCTKIKNQEFLAQSKNFFGFEIFVKCPYCKGSSELIKSVQDFIISKVGNLGIIILDNDQYEIIIANGITEQKYIKILTFDDLILKHTFLFEYVETVLSKLEIPQFFIEKFKGIANGTIVDMINYIDLLINNDTVQKIALLGDYGTGKTTFCYFYVHHCFEAYKNSKSMRLPIYLHMKKFSKHSSLFELVLEEINKKVFTISEYEIHELMRCGKILIIVDGIELVQSDISFETLIRLVDALGEFPSSKVLMIARTHYFINNLQLKRIKEYQIVYLKNWSLMEYESYLTERYKAKWKDIAYKIFNSFHLYEIFQTPLFATELCNIIDKGVGSHFDIFNELTNSWVEKNYYSYYLDTETKLDIIERIACSLYFGESLEFSQKDILHVIENVDVQTEKINEYKKDILTSSFFIRDKNDKYRFSHYSILEFFVSKALKKEINDFMKYSRYPYYFMQKKLTRGIYQFLSESICKKESLIELVNMTKNKTFEEMAYVGSNCISILRCMNAELINSDFSYCVLVDADFRNMNLSGSSFYGANLFTSNFDNCILDDTNFLETNLGFSSIKNYSGIFDFLVIDSSKLYLATMENTIVLYDIINNTVQDFFSIHNDSIWALCEMQDSPWFFSGGRDHRLIMWNKNGELIRIFDGHTDNIWKICVSSDNAYIASCSSDKTIKIWNIGSSSALLTLKSHTDVVRDITFLDDFHIYSCSIDKQVICWNLRKQDKEAVYKCPNELRCITPIDKGIAVGDDCGNIYFFDTKLNFLYSQKIHDVEIRSICYETTKNCIISGDSSGQISIYFLEKKVLKKFDPFGHFINRIRVFENYIYCVDFDGMISIHSFEGDIIYSVNVNRLVYKTYNKFSCSRMKISPNVELSESRKKYLVDLGAEIIE